MTDPQVPAYLEKMAALYASGANQPGYHRVLVYHDDWCAVWRTPPGVCDCDPDVELPPGGDKVEKKR